MPHSGFWTTPDHERRRYRQYGAKLSWVLWCVRHPEATRSAQISRNYVEPDGWVEKDRKVQEALALWLSSGIPIVLVPYGDLREEGARRSLVEYIGLPYKGSEEFIDGNDKYWNPGLDVGQGTPIPGTGSPGAGGR